MKRIGRISLWFAFAFILSVTNVSSSEEGGKIDPNDPLKRPLLEDPQLVQKLAQEIRDSYKSENWRGAESAVKRVIGPIAFNGKEPLVVKYANKEIHEAVVDLYLKLCEILHDSNKREEWLSPGEGGEWYQECLPAYGESTFSPRIYEVELFPESEGYPGRGVLGKEYFARVNTTRTLEVLLNSRAESDGKDIHALIYEPEKKDTRLQVNEAFEILAIMTRTAPDLLKSNKDKVHRWMAEWLDYFTYDPQWTHYDFSSRQAALDLLGFYADPADVPLVNRIVAEALVVKFNNRKNEQCTPEKLKDKAQKILKERFGK